MKCNLCKNEMTNEWGKHKDCGGDCLSCMAESGDSECMEYLGVILMNELYDEIHELIDRKLSVLSDDCENNVRQRMSDEFRFWKRHRA